MNEFDPTILREKEPISSAFDSESELLHEYHSIDILQKPNRVTEILVSLAKLNRNHGRFQKAIGYLYNIRSLIEQNTINTELKIIWQLELGRNYISIKTPSQARPLFKEAWALAIHANEEHFTVEIAYLMATIEPLKEKERWLLLGIELAETSKNQKAKEYLRKLYLMLGTNYFDLKQYKNSVNIFNRLVNIYTSPKDKDYKVAFWLLGRSLRVSGNPTEALKIQCDLQKEINDKEDGRIYEEIAECHLALKHQKEAEMFFAVAHELLSAKDWHPDGFPLKLKRLKDLGKV